MVLVSVSPPQVSCLNTYSSLRVKGEKRKNTEGGESSHLTEGGPVSSYIYTFLLSLNTVGAHRTKLIYRYLQLEEIYLSFRFDFLRIWFNVLKAKKVLKTGCFFVLFCFKKRWSTHIMTTFLKLELQEKYQILWRLAKLLYQPIHQFFLHKQRQMSYISRGFWW